VWVTSVIYARVSAVISGDAGLIIIPVTGHWLDISLIVFM